MLSFRIKKQASKNVADTTFKVKYVRNGEATEKNLTFKFLHCLKLVFQLVFFLLTCFLIPFNGIEMDLEMSEGGNDSLMDGLEYRKGEIFQLDE